MGRLTGRTVVVHPDTQAVVVLEAGDVAPEWAQIGDHLLDAPGSVPVKEPSAGSEDDESQPAAVPRRSRSK